MSDEVAALSAALAEVNELGRKLTAALEELNTHNSSSTAHEDIRKAVKDLIESGTIYTNDQIVEIVQSKLAAHANTDFKTAHPGWNEYSTNLEDRLTTMAADIVDLKSKIASQETTEPETELAAALQAITDKYAPILASLQEAFTSAKANGQDELATSYQQNIKETLDAQTAEMVAVLEAYRTSSAS